MKYKLSFRTKYGLVYLRDVSLYWNNEPDTNRVELRIDNLRGSKTIEDITCSDLQDMSITEFEEFMENIFKNRLFIVSTFKVNTP